MQSSWINVNLVIAKVGIQSSTNHFPRVSDQHQLSQSLKSRNNSGLVMVSGPTVDASQVTCSCGSLIWTDGDQTLLLSSQHKLHTFQKISKEQEQSEVTTSIITLLTISNHGLMSPPNHSLMDSKNQMKNQKILVRTTIWNMLSLVHHTSKQTLRPQLHEYDQIDKFKN